MRKKGVLHSSLLMIVARVLSAAASFVLFWVISQENVAQLGAFRTIFVFFLVCEFLPLFGMSHYIVREISLRHDCGREIFSSSVFFSGLTCILIIITLVVTAFFGNFSQDVSSGLFIIACSIPATCLVVCCQSVLVGAGEGASFGLFQGGEIITRTLIGLALFLFNPDILAIFYCFTLVRWLSLFLYLPKIRFLLKEGKWGFNPIFVKEFFRQVPSFSAILLFFLILRFAPQIMVPWMVGDTGAGYFSIVFQFLDLLLLIPTALATNLMPILAIHAQQSSQALAVTAAQSLKLITFLLFPTVIFIGIKANPLLLFIFGPKYEPAVILLSITICTGLIWALDQVFSTAMIASKRQNTDLITLAVSSIGMLVLLYVLTPYYGVIGAAIAFMAGSVLLIATRLTLFYFAIYPINILGALWRYFFAGTFMALGLIFTSFNLFFSTLIALGLYAVGLFLAGALTQAELLSLTSILRRSDLNKELTT